MGWSGGRERGGRERGNRAWEGNDRRGRDMAGQGREGASRNKTATCIERLKLCLDANDFVFYQLVYLTECVYILLVSLQ